MYLPSMGGGMMGGMGYYGRGMYGGMGYGSTIPMSFQGINAPQEIMEADQLKAEQQLMPQEVENQQQQLEQQNALAPLQMQEAQQKSQLSTEAYTNMMMANVASRASAFEGSDPAQASQIWDQGMKDLVAKGITSASQYIGRYTAPMAQRVAGAYGGQGNKNASAAPSFDQDAAYKQIQSMPQQQRTKVLQNQNAAIDGFNNVRDQESWNEEVGKLSAMGVNVGALFPPNVDWRLNYAKGYKIIQQMMPVRDMMADAVMSSGIGAPAAEPLPARGTTPSYSYVGTAPGTDLPVVVDRHTGQMVLSNQPIAAKPSAAVNNFQQKRDAWLQVHPGDNDGALQYAQGKRNPNPTQVMEMAQTQANRQLANLTLAGATFKDPEAWLRNQTSKNYQILSGNAALPAAPATAPNAPPKLSASDVQQSIANARAAIKAGKDRTVILQRLKAAGINTAGL